MLTTQEIHEQIYGFGEQLAYEKAVMLRSALSIERLMDRSESGFAAVVDAYGRSHDRVLWMDRMLRAFLDCENGEMRDAAEHALERVDDYVAPYAELLVAEAVR